MCRSRRNKLGAKCKAEVFRTQQDAVDDYRTDYQLYSACKDNAGTLCGDEDPDEVVDCLVSGRWRG